MDSHGPATQSHGRGMLTVGSWDAGAEQAPLGP